MTDVFDFEVDNDEDDAPSANPEERAVSVEDAVVLLQSLVPEAVDFLTTDWFPKWEKAEKYFNGETDLPLIEGRSKATETPVRDAIRHLKTSVMDVLASSEEIVEYYSNDPELAATAAEQTAYVNNTFWANNGYLVSLDIIQDALLKNIGIGKAVFEDNIAPKFYEVKNINSAMLVAYEQDPNISILDVTSKDVGEDVYYDLEVMEVKEQGTLKYDHVPLFEFFVSQDCTSEFDARVIGQRTRMFVSDAVALGLDADWDSIGDIDPETQWNSGESAIRRKFHKDDVEGLYEVDPTMKRVLITEVYAKFDLMGTGIPQLYRFWLGGEDYVYIDHELVDDVPYRRFLIEPQPASFFGTSIFDILMENQNVLTALIRATVDNAHASNDRRLAVHETMVNMSDVMSKKIGHPIRVRAPGMIQEIGTESTLGSMLPLLQDIRQQGEVKSGVTRAAMGLEPDALQSTDKEAVRNTIAAAQGIVRYITRNLVETGFTNLFRRLLALSIQHLPPIQYTNIDGVQGPVNQRHFDPDLPIRVKVGLGSAQVEMRIAYLSEVIDTQSTLMGQFGFDMPFTSIGQYYNALADKAKLMGVKDISRYFNAVPPEIMAQFQQKFEAESSPPPQPDPSAGLIESERIKGQVKMAEMRLEAELDLMKLDAENKQKMIDLLMKDDLERDKMIQQLEIERAKLEADIVNKQEVLAQQERNNDAKLEQIDRAAAQRPQNQASGGGSSTSGRPTSNSNSQS